MLLAVCNAVHLANRLQTPMIFCLLPAVIAWLGR